MTISDTTRTKLTEAFLSPNLNLGSGLGSYSEDPTVGERCTIAEINLVLRGVLTDDAHSCISEVIRRWVIRVQDGMPDEIRNSVAWRTAAIGIAGSASTPEVEKKRVALILDWMWDALADDAVLAAVPESARPAWNSMLTERTSAAAYAAYAVNADAYAAYYAARAAGDAYAAARANDAVARANDAADDPGYWEHRNPAKLLAELIEVR